MGWVLFNLVEGTIDHLALGVAIMRSASGALAASASRLGAAGGAAR